MVAPCDCGDCGGVVQYDPRRGRPGRGGEGGPVRQRERDAHPARAERLAQRAELAPVRAQSISSGGMAAAIVAWNAGSFDQCRPGRR